MSAKSSEEIRRGEFAAFLRSRRERLTPAGVGLPEGFRRRTPGLRREEVALLTGVGTTWYTWLEQGRDVKPAPQVLTALADALRLDPAERRHLSYGRPVAARDGADGSERVEESLRRMLDGLTGQPALLVGRRWDVLAWNRAAEALFGDYGQLVGDERNLMYMVFADRRHRRLLVDWEPLAKASLAMFRADSARFAGDADFERLIAVLKRTSPEFRVWWPKHEVLSPLSGRKRIRHPIAGPMVFEYSSFNVTGQPDLKLIVYTPLAEAQTVDKLEELLQDEGDRPAAVAVGKKLIRRA